MPNQSSPAVLTLAAIAENIPEVSLHGDGTTLIHRVATLQNAQLGSITFLNNPRYRHYLSQCQASAVLLSEDDVSHWSGNALVCKNIHWAWALVVAQFVKSPIADGPRIHDTAIIAKTARVAATATIAARVVIGENCVIGEHCHIGAGSVLENGVSLGEACQIHAQVTLYHDIQLGDRVVVHSGAVIGADGFGFAHDGQRFIKIAQLGSVIIGDDCDIGANTTIDRGAIENTVLENGVKLDNQIQIAHNVRIGENTVIAACTGISGSTQIGKNCIIGGGVGFAGHLTIADGVSLTGFAMVTHSINQAGVYSSGLPVMENRVWHKLVGRIKRIDKLQERVQQLEHHIGI